MKPTEGKAMFKKKKKKKVRESLFPDDLGNPCYREAVSPVIPSPLDSRVWNWWCRLPSILSASVPPFCSGSFSLLRA